MSRSGKKSSSGGSDSGTGGSEGRRDSASGGKSHHTRPLDFTTIMNNFYGYNEENTLENLYGCNEENI